MFFILMAQSFWLFSSGNLFKISGFARGRKVSHGPARFAAGSKNSGAPTQGKVGLFAVRALTDSLRFSAHRVQCNPGKRFSGFPNENGLDWGRGRA